MPQIFLTNTPATAHARRTLRARALDLHQRLARINEGPCLAIMNVELPEQTVDLVLLRPRSVLVGQIQEAEDAITVQRNHPWLLQARAARAALLNRLESEPPQTAEPALLPLPLGTPVAAVVVAPALHAESQITLDIEDHRQRVKVLGLDELAPLAAMLQAGAQLDQAAMLAIAQRLGATLWHDDEQLRFEIGLAPYVLQVLGGDAPQRYQLLEGANVLGRRTVPLQYEYRLVFSGDDSISADHAILICAPDGRVILRDTSTNGSYIRTASGEQRVHHAEQPVPPGTVLRIGETVLRLEPAA